MIASFIRRRESMQKRFPNVLFHGSHSHRAVSLTFDDGPHPRDTPQVLDLLAEHDIRATFFLIGRDVERHPNLAKRIHQDGHQPALHCHRHIPFPMQNASTLKGQLDRVRTAIADACSLPPETIRDVRPPYGFFTANTLSLLGEWGYRLVLWDNMPLHFIQPAGRSIDQILERTVPGSVIVLHDGHGHGAKVTQILEAIIPRLKTKGFEFVTIEQMQLGLSQPAGDITGETK